MNLVRKNNKWIVPQGRSKMSHGGPPPHPEDIEGQDSEMLGNVSIPGPGWTEAWKMDPHADDAGFFSAHPKSIRGKWMGKEGVYERAGGPVGDRAGTWMWNKWLDTIDKDHYIRSSFTYTHPDDGKKTGTKHTFKPGHREKAFKDYYDFYAQLDWSNRKTATNEFYREMKKLLNKKDAPLLRDATGAWVIPDEVLNYEWGDAVAESGVNISQMYNRVVGGEYWRQNDKEMSALIDKVYSHIQKHGENLWGKGFGSPEYLKNELGLNDKEIELFNAYTNDVQNYLNTNLGIEFDKNGNVSYGSEWTGGEDMTLHYPTIGPTDDYDLQPTISYGPGEHIWGIGRGKGFIKTLKQFPKLFKKRTYKNFWKNNIKQPIASKANQLYQIARAYNPFSIYTNYGKAGGWHPLIQLRDMANLEKLKKKIYSIKNIKASQLDPRNIFLKDWSAAIFNKIIGPGPFSTYYRIGPAAGTLNDKIRKTNILKGNQINPQYSHMTGNFVNPTGGKIGSGQFGDAAFYNFKYGQGIDPTRLTLYKGYTGSAEKALKGWNTKLGQSLSKAPNEGLLFGPQFGPQSVKHFNIPGGSPFILNNRGYMTHQQMRWNPKTKMYEMAPELGGGILGGQGIYGRQAGLNQANYYNRLFGNQGMGQLGLPYQKPNLFNINIQQAGLRNALNYRINPYLQTTSSWNPTFRPLIGEGTLWNLHRGSIISREYDRYKAGTTNRYDWLLGPNPNRNPMIQYHDQWPSAIEFLMPSSNLDSGNPFWLFETKEQTEKRRNADLQRFLKNSLSRFNYQQRKKGEKEAKENPYQMKGPIYEPK